MSSDEDRGDDHTIKTMDELIEVEPSTAQRAAARHSAARGWHGFCALQPNRHNAPVHNNAPFAHCC